MAKITLFAQIFSKLNKDVFKKIVHQKQTDKYQKGFDSWTHLISMLFVNLPKVSLYVISAMVYALLQAT